MNVGTFLVSYTSAETIPGGYVLNMRLVVDVVNKTASGLAQVTQATNPPLDVQLPVQGPVIDMTVMPNTTYHRMNLESPGGMLGRHLTVTSVVGDNWQTGTANVQLFLDTPQGTVHFTTPIKSVQANQVAAA
jgi:hypothetical protein